MTCVDAVGFDLLAKHGAESVPAEPGYEMGFGTEPRQAHRLVRTLPSRAASKTLPDTGFTCSGNFLHVDDQVGIGASHHDCLHF